MSEKGSRIDQPTRFYNKKNEKMIDYLECLWGVVNYFLVKSKAYRRELTCWLLELGDSWFLSNGWLISWDACFQLGSRLAGSESFNVFTWWKRKYKIGFVLNESSVH